MPQGFNDDDRDGDRGEEAELPSNRCRAVS
jgi:hypothetical protein